MYLLFYISQYILNNMKSCVKSQKNTSTNIWQTKTSIWITRTKIYKVRSIYCYHCTNPSSKVIKQSLRITCKTIALFQLYPVNKKVDQRQLKRKIPRNIQDAKSTFCIQEGENLTLHVLSDILLRSKPFRHGVVCQ